MRVWGLKVEELISGMDDDDELERYGEYNFFCDGLSVRET